MSEDDIKNTDCDNPIDSTRVYDDRALPLPEFDVDNLSKEIAFKKLRIESRISDRRLTLEERRLDHRIAMENRIEDFKESEALRLNKYMDSRDSENWMKSYWRPVMGWIYALICLFDFVIAPTITIVVSGITEVPLPVWKSLTLENGGLIHLAFAAILGVTAWTRGQESIIKTKMSTMNMANGTTGYTVNNGNTQQKELEL